MLVKGGQISGALNGVSAAERKFPYIGITDQFSKPFSIPAKTLQLVVSWRRRGRTEEKKMKGW